MSVSVEPIRPSSVEQTTASFQVVILSASLKLICARPCLSVSTEGGQTRVSGKYSRSRGVSPSRAPDFVITFTFLVNERPLTGSAVVVGSDPAVTVTVSAPPATWSSATICVRFVSPTGTLVKTAGANPVASIRSSYSPGGRSEKTNLPSSFVTVLYFLSSPVRCAVTAAFATTAPAGSITLP